MRKRFVKLLLFKVDTQYRLLYGFSSETEQSSYPWKTFPADRKGQKLIAKAILSPSEADNFLISLTGTEPIMLCERVTLKSPQLYKREQLLYSDDEEQQAVPISEFCYLFEFWNREKLSLLSEIQNEFSADGRTRYEQTLELLEWAKCNCGIDFCIDGRRFGNYEVYYRTPENSSFEIDIHKDQGLRVTTIRKCKDFAEDIIVNCIGKYKDYVICNQTQVWPANKKEIYFEANEPMTSVVVHAWNTATGKLIVSQSIALMMGLSIISSWGSTPYQIGDSWTNKLLHSVRGLTWLTCGYHMALKLDITGFLTLLSQLRSPMMFDIDSLRISADHGMDRLVFRHAQPVLNSGAVLLTEHLYKLCAKRRARQALTDGAVKMV